MSQLSNQTKARMIQKVKEHPALYDKDDENYRETEYRERVWAIIADELKVEAEDVKRTWRGLRDTLVKTNKKASLDGKPNKWKHYKAMKFIEPHMRNQYNPVSSPELSVLVSDVKNTGDESTLYEDVMNWEKSSDENDSETEVDEPSSKKVKQEIGEIPVLPNAVSLSNYTGYKKKKALNIGLNKTKLRSSPRMNTRSSLVNENFSDTENIGDMKHFMTLFLESQQALMTKQMEYEAEQRESFQKLMTKQMEFEEERRESFQTFMSKLIKHEDERKEEDRKIQHKFLEKLKQYDTETEERWKREERQFQLQMAQMQQMMTMQTKILQSILQTRDCKCAGVLERNELTSSGAVINTNLSASSSMSINNTQSSAKKDIIRDILVNDKDGDLQKSLESCSEESHKTVASSGALPDEKDSFVAESILGDVQVKSLEVLQPVRELKRNENGEINAVTAVVMNS